MEKWIILPLVIFGLLILFAIYSPKNFQIYRNNRFMRIIQEDRGGNRSEQIRKIMPKDSKWLDACQKYLPAEISKDWGSHVVLLLASIFLTTGPIVEFGCGFHSTPLIHDFCLGTKRIIVSADSKLEWVQKFTKYNSSTHRIVHAENWDKIAPNCGRFEYGVILVDHAPGERRITDLIRLANCAQIVLLHDTEVKGLYGYGPGLAKYRYSYETAQFETGVMALSNFKRTLIKEVERLVNIYRIAYHRDS